jgi:predicted GTPase
MESGSSFQDEFAPDAFSYPASHTFADELEAGMELNNHDQRPRILLMGTRRSGKSSIQKVVFHKMSPHETLFLESTNEVRNRDISTSALVQFQLLDFPGNFDFFDKKSKITPEKIFSQTGALVFVIDAQDDETYSEAIDYFGHMAKIAYRMNPKIGFDVLIHKVKPREFAKPHTHSTTTTRSRDCKRQHQSTTDRSMAMRISPTTTRRRASTRSRKLSPTSSLNPSSPFARDST